MNINFIGKEFEKLAELDNYINYEFEPKTNIRKGKRNIYFNEIKHEFIDDVNVYGFSPYILQSFIEQRENPNIRKYIKKNFNYGLTNYIKIRTRNVEPLSTRIPKKIKLKKNIENKNDIFKLIPDIFIIKGKYKNKNIEHKDNFLKKVFGEMGNNNNHKINVSIDEVEKNEKKDNNKKFIFNNQINNNVTIKKNNIELIKNIILINKEKEKDKNKTLSFNKLDIFGSNNNNIKITNLKNFFEKINLINQNNNNKIIDNKNNKKVLTLSKNKNILGNKKLFSSLSSRNIKSVETSASNSHRKKRYIKNTFEIPKNLIMKNRNKFLLFEKAVPYKYVVYSQTHK